MMYHRIVTKSSTSLARSQSLAPSRASLIDFLKYSINEVRMKLLLLAASALLAEAARESKFMKKSIHLAPELAEKEDEILKEVGAPRQIKIIT